MSVKEYREQIGVQILKDMNDADELPLPNVRRLARVMMEYFRRDGYQDELKELGYVWRPDEDYWINKIGDVAETLRKELLYFGYHREWGQFKGQWKFMAKSEYQQYMRREGGDLSTRTDHYNEKLEDGMKRWKLNLPPFSSPPLLPPVRQ